MNLLKTKKLVKEFAQHLSFLFAETTLYPSDHPSVIAQEQHACAALERVFSEIKSFYLDVLEGQFVFEEIPLYELKHLVEKTTELLSSKYIQRIYFSPGLAPQELALFVRVVLEAPKDPDLEALKSKLKKESVLNIRVESTDSLKDSKKKDSLKPEKTYSSGIEANKLIYNAIKDGKLIPLDAVNRVAEDITSMITQDRSSIIALTCIRDYDEYTFTHSVNVAVLSAALSSTILSDTTFLQRIAKAALLHDIGKIQIPIEIINKPGNLSPEDWKVIKQHPLLGAKVLEEQEEVDKLAVLVATQHHMRYDLTGYPRIEKINQLHPISLVVNIVDIYDAITSKRPYNTPLTPDKALPIMMRLIGSDFDPQLFKLFIHMMGVYPPGSFVRLNTKEIAVTRRVHPQTLLLPEIKIITDHNGNLLEKPKNLDLSNKEKNSSGRKIEEIVAPEKIGINALDFL